MAVHPIFSLILANNLIEVISLIQSDPGAVDARTHSWSPLHYSCFYNRTEITVHLLKHGADVDCREEQGGTPLHIAAQEGHLATVKILLEYNASIDFRTKLGFTPLHLAARKGHLEIVKYIHQKRRSTLSDVDIYGRTGLHIASDNGHNDIVEWMLTQDNVNVDAAENRNWTSLHTAALKSHPECCETLLKHEADVNAVNNRSQTPLHWACQTGDLNTVLTLMKYKPQIIFNVYGYSPLHTAAWWNRDTIVEILISQFGWDVNMVSRMSNCLNETDFLCLEKFKDWIQCSYDCIIIFFTGGH